jgi:hypothetical protein
MNDKLINVSASLDEPNKLVDFAQTLKQVIIDQKLYTNIQGKNYVHVEAWQFCGGVLKVFPVVTELVDLSDDKVVKYRAQVELRRVTGELIGGGIAICSNKEKGKQFFDEYAVASMAQTRAVSKAYRNAFGWLMKLAGYEATPAEEMDVRSDAEKKSAIVEAYAENLAN